MTPRTLLMPAVGGLLIGGASVLLFQLNGRILGISGIAGGLLDGPSSERSSRASFLVGLLVGAAALVFVAPSAFGASPAPLPWLALAGLLVGFGTRLGNGCTSGHGVCGNSRLSPRSMVATVTFIAAGMLAVAVAKRLGALP